jgi:hypothetical protein
MGRILRIIIVTIFVVFALRAVRMVWSALTGGGSTTARGPGAGGAARGPSRAQADAVPTSGVLRKCGHCGVYVSEALALKEAGGAEPVYFCSAECRKLGRA